MNTLNWRYASRFLRWALLLTLTVTAFDTATNALESLSFLLTNKFNTNKYIYFLILGIPESIEEILPLAALTAGLLTTTLPSARAEILHLHGSGLIPIRLFLPITLAALLIGCVEFIIQEHLGPKAQVLQSHLERLAGGSKKENPPSAWLFFEGRYVYIEADSRGHIHLARVIERDETGTITDVQAAGATKEGERWRLHNPKRLRLIPGETIHEAHLENAFLPASFNLEAIMAGDPKRLGLKRLLESTALRRAGGLSHSNFDVALVIRLVWPPACVWLALLGAWAGILHPRKVSTSKLFARSLLFATGALVNIGAALVMVQEGLLEAIPGAFWSFASVPVLILAHRGERKGRRLKRPLHEGGN